MGACVGCGDGWPSFRELSESSFRSVSVGGWRPWLSWVPCHPGCSAPGRNLRSMSSGSLCLCPARGEGSSPGSGWCPQVKSAGVLSALSCHWERGSVALGEEVPAEVNSQNWGTRGSRGGGEKYLWPLSRYCIYIHIHVCYRWLLKVFAECVRQSGIIVVLSAPDHPQVYFELVNLVVLALTWKL